jgi:ABA responsive element binding factor
MAASPNPLGNGSLVAAASSALQGGGAGGGLGGSRFNSLARQSSIYSLTLDEFQNAMTEPGKNFGSMNMDEFLKNIWTAEESQAMAAAMGSSSIAAADTNQAAGNVDGMSMLLRQPSLQLLQGAMSLPRTLSRKTVDQVWKDIHRDSSSGGSDSGGGLPFGPSTTSAQERQTTFGEMTLEDFLMKAGVVREDAADIGTSQQQQGFSSFMGNSGLHPHGERSDRINVQSGDPGDRISGATAATGGGDIVPTLSLSPANVMPSQASIDAMQMDAYNKNQVATAASQQQQQVHSDLILQFSH